MLLGNCCDVAKVEGVVLMEVPCTPCILWRLQCHVVCAPRVLQRPPLASYVLLLIPSLVVHVVRWNSAALVCEVVDGL